MKLLTIGIGTYIRDKSYMYNTIKSIIENLLNNGYINLVKIMVVNDYPTQVQDYIICKQFSKQYNGLFQLIKNEDNKGIAYTYNKIIKECNTQYFMAFDSDDVLNIHYNIMNTIKILEQNKNYAGAYSKRQLCDFDKKINYGCCFGSNYNLKNFINFQCPISHNAVILRTEDAIKTGNYIPQYLKYIEEKHLRICCDISMFTSMLLYKDLYFDQQVSTLYNDHDKCYHKGKCKQVIQQFETIAKCVIKYCQQKNFIYKNMQELYYSANNFLENEQCYIENSWLKYQLNKK